MKMLLVRLAIIYIVTTLLIPSFARADIGNGEEEQALVTSPDVIYFNGHIVTMETDAPTAEAIAITGEDIVALGSNAEILQLSGSETQLIDLEGKAVLPGFIDTHAHYFQSYYLGDLTLDEVQNTILEGGTTTVVEMFVNQDILTILQELEQTDSLRVRTNAYLVYCNACGEIMGDWYLEHPPVLDTSRMLRIPGVKMYSDGGSCLRAAMSVYLPEWYVLDDPMGDLFFTSEELADMILDAQSHGYQVAIHALGDRAIETVLDAYDIALDGQPNIYHHRLEHNNLPRPDYMQRYSEIGVIVSGFWLSPGITWGLFDPNNPMRVMIDANPEADMESWLQPWRTLLDANPGLHACWQTDWLNNYITGLGPIPDLFSMVTRKKIGLDSVSIWEPPDWFADEAITVEEALRIMTIEGAYALFMEEETGSLKQGKLADLVILSENPLTIEPDDIINIQVLLTMVGGKTEYCAPGFENLDPSIPRVPVVIDFNPHTFKLGSNGQWVTVCVEMPEGYDVHDINCTTVMLNGEIPASVDKWGRAKAGTDDFNTRDRDGDGIPERMLKFDRAAVGAILSPGDKVVITLTGKVAGDSFQGIDIIRVIGKG